MAFQLDPSGLPVFKQNEEIWHLRVTGEDPNGYLKIFENWLCPRLVKGLSKGFPQKLEVLFQQMSFLLLQNVRLRLKEIRTLAKAWQ